MDATTAAVSSENMDRSEGKNSQPQAQFHDDSIDHYCRLRADHFRQVAGRNYCEVATLRRYGELGLASLCCMLLAPLRRAWTLRLKA